MTISAVSTRDTAGLRKPEMRRCTRQAAARAHMHIGPADACAWAHPRWGRAAEDEPRRLPVFERRADVDGRRSMRVVKEQALCVRSGDGAAPSRCSVEQRKQNKRPGSLRKPGLRRAWKGGVSRDLLPMYGCHHSHDRSHVLVRMHRRPRRACPPAATPEPASTAWHRAGSWSR